MNVVEPILRDRYEVIIVGAGIGGLTAGAMLAREGIDVLVIEQAHQPGGCCTSFRAGALPSTPQYRPSKASASSASTS